MSYLHEVRYKRNESDVEESPRCEGQDVHEGRLQVAAGLEHQGDQSPQEANQRCAHLSFCCFPPESRSRIILDSPRFKLPFKARLEEDGKVPELMRDLVQEDGGGGGDAQLGAGQERGAHCQTMEEIVSAGIMIQGKMSPNNHPLPVGKEVEISNYLSVRSFSQLRVCFWVTELQYLLQHQE